MNVLTNKGLVEFSTLDISDIVEVGDNYRKITTEYRLNGELVRNDVVANALRPIELAATEGVING